VPARRPRRPARGVVAALTLCAAALGGCGPLGDDEELTDEQYEAEGNAICESGREQYLELQQDPPQSSAAAAELTRNLIEITEGEIEDLGDLDAPLDREDALQDYLDSREAGVRILEEGLAAAEDEDAEAYAEAQAQIARGQVDRARLAEKAGLTECSRPLTD
jgi:hypothetical protein